MTTWVCTRQNELTHHGIKGMKWGVRRFQNEDGSLTPAGRKRYDEPNRGTNSNVKKSQDTKSKSLHRLKLEEKYRTGGLSKEEAEQKATKRIKAEAYIAAAAGITVASCLAYAKHKNYTTDKVFKENTEFQRIMRLSPNAIIRDDSRQYIAINKRDKVKYKGLYAQRLNDLNKTPKSIEQGLKVYDVTMKNKKEMRVASRKRAEDTFKNLYLNDDTFRQTLKEDAKHIGIGRTVFENVRKKIYNGEELNNRDLKKAYDYFNTHVLMDRNLDGSNNKLSNMFFDSLRKQGINAIQDVNDQKYSGYRAKLPIITFDNSFEYTKRAMDDKEIKTNHRKALADVLSPAIMTTGAVYVGIYGAAPVVNKVRIDKQVLLYKQDHPNTKMTDAEIRDMIKKELSNQ